ncbi:hypothetical protein D3C86_1455490 [compost metagenome]
MAVEIVENQVDVAGRIGHCAENRLVRHLCNRTLHNARDIRDNIAAASDLDDCTGSDVVVANECSVEASCISDRYAGKINGLDLDARLCVAGL